MRSNKPHATVQIKDTSKKTLVHLGATLPPHLRLGLFDRLEAVFPQGLRETDTQSEGAENVFECLHFSWYNRSTTRVRIH